MFFWRWDILPTRAPWVSTEPELRPTRAGISSLTINCRRTYPVSRPSVTATAAALYAYFIQRL